MVKNRSKICIIISLAIFAVALLMTLTGNGINTGVDFAGGLSMTYTTGSQKVDATIVSSTLRDMGLDGSVTVQGENQNEVKLQIRDISSYANAGEAATEAANGNMVDANSMLVQNVQTEFVQRLSATYPELAQTGEVSYVGPVAGAALLKNAFLSVVIASLLMLVYIAIRFDFNSGLAAVLGLVHDVLMMLAFMVLLRSIIQMNSSFIAAMLTIVGYSINNTIVIFDRIRENARKMSAAPRANVVGVSIRECLGRTLTTTATTLVTIVMLYVLGVPAIKEFALPIIIGIVSGVYSANMINGYIWAFLEEKKIARKAAKVSKPAKAA